MSETPLPTGFDALTIPESLKERLRRLGFVEPTPIQALSIPPALHGRDVMGIAQTGTGKTLAFGIPIASRLPKGKTALILAPTRELVEQISETFEKLGLSFATLIGGKPYHSQFKALEKRPKAIIATPGRLRDLMNRGSVDLDAIAMVVLDEADRMLDMGFAEAIEGFFKELPDDCQVMLYSATMPEEIESMAQSKLRLPAHIEVAPQGTAAETVSQELIVSSFEDRPEILKEVLTETEGTILVFARTRHGARKLAVQIEEWGFSVAAIHADLTQAARREAMDGFRQGDHRILVATDIAARGIDVKNIELVINYDLPDNPSDYIHRIGRTGRAGVEGRAISFALHDQRHEVRSIEFLLKSPLTRSEKSRGDIRGAAAPVRKSRPGSNQRFRRRTRPGAAQAS